MKGIASSKNRNCEITSEEKTRLELLSTKACKFCLLCWWPFTNLPHPTSHAYPYYVEAWIAGLDFSQVCKRSCSYQNILLQSVSDGLRLIMAVPLSLQPVSLQHSSSQQDLSKLFAIWVLPLLCSSIGIFIHHQNLRSSCISHSKTHPTDFAILLALQFVPLLLIQDEMGQLTATKTALSNSSGNLVTTYEVLSFNDNPCNLLIYKISRHLIIYPSCISAWGPVKHREIKLDLP